MTRIEFELLSKQEQIRKIRTYGVFITDRIVGGNRFYLFAINTFLVELIHELSNINNKGLEIVRTFDHAEECADYDFAAKTINTMHYE